MSRVRSTSRLLAAWRSSRLRANVDAASSHLFAAWRSSRLSAGRSAVQVARSSVLLGTLSRAAEAIGSRTQTAAPSDRPDVASPDGQAEIGSGPRWLAALLIGLAIGMVATQIATSLTLAPFSVVLLLVAVWVARLPAWQQVLADSTLASHRSDPGDT